MIVAVVSLAILAGALGAGMIYAVKWGRDESKTAKNAHDLYRAQVQLTDEIRIERDELIGRLAATDEQLREAKIRLGKTEEQRNRALDEARELVRQQIRSAPDAIAALNKILAAAPHGVHAEGSAETKADSTKADTGTGGSDPLLITSLP